jgi:hypothetical protein
MSACPDGEGRPRCLRLHFPAADALASRINYFVAALVPVELVTFLRSWANHSDALTPFHVGASALARVATARVVALALLVSLPMHSQF